MKKQPDFQKLFFDYFGPNPKKIVYSIRPDSNRYHDLIFLKSLIHDARLKRNYFKLRGKRVTIQLDRDCWELGIVEHKDVPELYNCNCRLSVSPVLDIEWRYDQSCDIDQDTELWINDVFLTRVDEDFLSIVIDGDGWSIHMKAADDSFKMILRDLEVPYLYSQKS